MSASAATGGSLTAAFVKTSDWGSGFEGSYTVTNGTSAAVNSWSITFTLPAGEAATSAWNATFTALGNNTYRLDSPTWAGPLAAGASASAVGIEFTNTGSTGAAPSTCTIDNAPCSGGDTTPPTTPSSSVTSVPTTPSSSVPTTPSSSVPTTPSSSV
ncbi:cellulose binding domain-containing protein, partial [Catenulispora subtropica]|uniref:cellulose binding domain-containing protein n=1 Tax=Catenulispora subtropica TaxID=450798 RepID=UPI003CD0777C